MKKAGRPSNREPVLHLALEAIDEMRNHLHVVTSHGTKMLLAWDAKANRWHLHCFTPRGAIGGKVFNDWTPNTFLAHTMEDRKRAH